MFCLLLVVLIGMILLMTELLIQNISNIILAATNILQSNIEKGAKVIHGAKLFAPWPRNVNLAIVVSDYDEGNLGSDELCWSYPC